jgi:hypothetical protein
MPLPDYRVGSPRRVAGIDGATTSSAGNDDNSETPQWCTAKSIANVNEATTGKMLERCKDQNS